MAMAMPSASPLAFHHRPPTFLSPPLAKDLPCASSSNTHNHRTASNPRKSSLIARNAHIENRTDPRRWHSKLPFNNIALSCAMLSIAVTLPQFESAAASSLEPLLSIGFPWEKVLQQPEPPRGSCATCVGVVDDTLGSCDAVRNCLSTFDDRFAFFVAPWEFPGQLSTAVESLKNVLVGKGAVIKEQSERYIYAIFTGKDDVIDDVEFLFSPPSVDATVNIRAASRAIELNDNGRNQRRLANIRQALGWEEVPILRNRKRKLFFLESPWDSFGPEPPPVYDYKDGSQFVPD